ncbi:MAG: VWA domain-containing protein [Deltaproteobacteria bacterium]|nr:VWA domain-containing protein [Deltaproteobacteria bacterium]
MKPLLPFALLGSFGVAGVVAGTSPLAAVGLPVAPIAASSLSKDLGPVKVEASLERTHLLANQAGNTYARVALIGIADALQQKARVPVSLTLVIDRSGSMGGEDKMDAAEDAACKALQELSPGDRFAVISFDNGADVLVSNKLVDSSGTSAACQSIKALTARGSTDMHSGLLVGGAEAQKIMGQGRVNRLMLLSDGQPDNESGLAEQAKALARLGVTTTTIGLGSDYNEDLMARISDQGLGNSYFVESRKEKGGGSAQLATIFQTELKSMAEVVAKNAAITLTPKNGLIIEDVTGFAFDKSGNKFIIPVGDVYGGRTTDVLVRVRHGNQQEGVIDLLDVDVSFQAAKDDQHFASTLAVNATFTKDHNAVVTSTVADVAVKATEWQTATAMVEANDAFNRGDFAEGDKILGQQKVRVQAAAKEYKSDQLNTLLGSVGEYQAENSAGGMGMRGAMNKKAKALSRDVTRASGTYTKK